MNPRYPMKRLPSEPTRVSASTLRSTPNFKAAHTTHTDEHTESDYSQEIPFAHKSFDVSTGLTSRSLLKPNNQHRPLSGKKERPTEPIRGGSFDSGPDSHRKSSKSINPATKTFQHKISEMAAAASHRSLSQRDKPFFAVPIMDMSRKSSQDARPPIGSSRDRPEEEYSTRMANLESFTLSPSKVLGRYQNLVKAYEELVNRNKQAEESLRLEVIRGEEQRAYIEMLKRVIEENKNKPCQFCVLREQKDGIRSDRKMHGENMAFLNNEVETLRVNEGRLIQDIETFRDRLKDVNSEKEMMVAQLGHSQEAVDKMNNEIKRLKESVLIAQKETNKVKEENSILVEQMKQGSGNECKKLRKELEQLEINYEDLKMLSNEIENQRKVGTKMLEEEIRERRKAEVEKNDTILKLKEMNNVIELKEQDKAELEKTVEEERMMVRELQQKLEILEDNYSTLRMTLNENENELEKLKSIHDRNNVNEEEMNKLKEENIHLKEKLEEIQKATAEEKAKLRNGYESNHKRLRQMNEDLRSAYSTNEKVKEECELLKSEKNILFQKVENLEEAQRKSQKNSMVMGGSNANDIIKKYEDRERVLKMLKDQVNLLEKENSLLKNSQDTSRHRNTAADKLKEENFALQQRNEVIGKKFQELREKWESLRIEHSQVVQEVGHLREDLGRIELELTEIVETYLPQEDRLDTDAGLLSHREITEEDYGRINSLMHNIKKKIERLNERYNQAKLDLVREMERCVEIEKENENDSVLKKENMVLREKLERLSQEFVETDKEKSLLKISNENLLQKFSHVNMQVQSLKKELEGMHNKENQLSGLKRSLVDNADPINSDIKLKDAMIKRLEAFVFNLDVKELLEEMLHIETRILKISKTKEKVPFRHSLRSTSTLDPTERKENSFLESRSTMRGDVDDMTDELEIQKAKRDTLENELSKLEEQERKRYDSLNMLEKQNFELKSEISRLMNELEINFSEYKDSKSEYYSRKMNERFMFSNGGYDFALEGLEHKGHRDATISDFHMDYSMEKISGEDAEDPYYS